MRNWHTENLDAWVEMPQRGFCEGWFGRWDWDGEGEG